MAPPSIHPNGQPYEWEQDLEEYGIVEASSRVYQFLHPAEEKSNAAFQSRETIPEGQRNATIFKAACSMRDKDYSEDAIAAAVKAENNSKCIPPLEDKEVEIIIESALKYEPEHKYTATTKNGIITRKRGSIADLSMKSLANVEVREAEWFVSDYIPRYQITTFGGDGGSAKTTTWCSIVAAVSSGKVTMFEESFAGKVYNGEPQKVFFFSSEDPVEEVLKPKILKHGGNMENISFIDLKDERFQDIKFGSQFLENLIKEHRPSLVVFDPLQSFIDEKVQMGSRNAMRSCLNPLVGICSKYKVTVIIIAHANKAQGVWGRKRLADSADIWDISRAVFLFGSLEKGLFYISQEKNNYGPINKSLLFSLDGGTVTPKGFTEKHDKDFMQAEQHASKQAPQREEAKNLILDYLQENGGEVEVKELADYAEAMGVSDNTLSRAKTDLKKEGKVNTRNTGNGKEKVFYISLSPIG